VGKRARHSTGEDRTHGGLCTSSPPLLCRANPLPHCSSQPWAPCHTDWSSAERHISSGRDLCVLARQLPVTCLRCDVCDLTHAMRCMRYDACGGSASNQLPRSWCEITYVWGQRRARFTRWLWYSLPELSRLGAAKNVCSQICSITIQEAWQSRLQRPSRLAPRASK
jgi:hypothetical protein